MNSFLSPGSIKVVPTPKSGLPKSTPALYYLELNLELNLAKFSRPVQHLVLEHGTGVNLKFYRG